jgi:hypothetical protein
MPPRSRATCARWSSAGWVTLGAGDDARSRRVEATAKGREKRQEAQRRWRVAQESLNQRLGTQRVLALHALLDECQELLAELPAKRPRAAASTGSAFPPAYMAVAFHRPAPSGSAAWLMRRSTTMRIT